jgi:hypothetical protein
MLRKTNYFLNIKRTKKFKNFYELISMKLNAAKKVNEKKKHKKKKTCNYYHCKKEKYYIKNCYKKRK